MKRLFLALTILFFAIPANADTLIDVSYNSTLHPFAAVDYTYSNGGNDYTGGVAGEIGIRIYNNDGSGWVQDKSIFSAFCIDLPGQLWQGYEPGSVAANSDVSYLDQTVFGQVAWLYDTFWTATNSVEQDAALQLAIWDTIHTDLSFTVSTSMDDPNKTDDIYDLYKKYVDDLAANTYTGNMYRVVVLDDASKQDLIVKVAPVPEPGTMLLFGIGLLGVAARGRKR